MLKWIKDLFGKKQEPLVLTNPINEVVVSHETLTNEADDETKDNLSSMSKSALLAEAKRRGIKANASLKKDDLINRLKNAD